MSLLDSLPIVLINIIFDYKTGLEQSDKMNKCCKEINKIEHTYFYDNENECYETTVVKEKMETIYYINDGHFDEIEMSKRESNRAYKYWCFEDNRLQDYYKI